MTAPIRTLALASTAMLLAAPAFAASFTPPSFVALGPTEIAGTAAVDQFDGSLGTLLSVDWEVTGGFESDVALTNTGTAAQNVDATASINFLFSNFVPGTFSVANQAASDSTGVVSVPAGETLNFDLEGMFSASGTVSTNLAGWIGAGTVGFDYETLTGLGLSGGGGNITAGQSTGAGLEFSVTYNYREPSTGEIPLPAAGWMLLTALAGLGGAGWYRRRSS